MKTGITRVGDRRVEGVEEAESGRRAPARRSAPASVVSRPPWKSAMTVLEPRLEKSRVSRLQSVIAVA